MLIEMICCSTDYSKSPDFTPKNRFLFKGTSCFPISPGENKESVSENDQLIKLLERYSIDPDVDFSFVTNEDGETYLKEALSKTSK